MLDIAYTPPETEPRNPHGLINLGGSSAANEAANENDWPATTNFITSH